MDFLELLKAIFTSPWLYGITLVVVMTSLYSAVRKPLRRIPILNNKSGLIIVCLIGLAATLGLLGTMGSFGTGSMISGEWSISDVQITGLASNASGSVALDGSNIYMIQSRHTDAQANETAGIYEISASTFTITRTGKLNADSCRVIINSGNWDIDETTGTVGTAPFNILEKDATGRYKTYFNDATTQATTSDNQQSVSVAFAEGVSQETFTMLLNIDEESHDALNQYSTRDAIIDICGFPIVVRESRM